MLETPKGMRKHIALLGKRNAGKSSLLNAICGQDAAIVSPMPGTTTDPVEKTMEIKGLGPAVLVDTAGIDDSGDLGAMRIERSLDILRRVDMAIVVVDPSGWSTDEQKLVAQLQAWDVPFIVVRNKIDLGIAPDITTVNAPVIDVSAKTRAGVEELIRELGQMNLETRRQNEFLLADLLPEDGLAVLVAPIDTGAPQGRLILPQVQAIRDCLDGGKICLVLTAAQYKAGLEKLNKRPDLVVCDSQVVGRIAAETPPDWRMTTFSILMARFKGDLPSLAAGAAALTKLKSGDTVLIQEACSHHPQKEDIGRVKIPAMLKRMAGGDLNIIFAAGKEFKEYDPNIKAVVHCGACVITRKQMLSRQNASCKSGCPMTNYGVAISLAQGVLPRTLALFPDALAAYKKALAKEA